MLPADVTSFIPVSIYAIAYNEIPLTLNHNLVTGNQYLLAITRLCVLQYCGPGMGCCCIGHGESRKALDSVCTIISQLDGPSLRDCNCAINGMNGGEKGDNQSELSWTQRRQGGICVSVVDITQSSPTVLSAAGLVNGCGDRDGGDCRGGRSRRILLGFLLLDARDSGGVGWKVVQDFPVDGTTTRVTCETSTRPAHPSTMAQWCSSPSH